YNYQFGAGVVGIEADVNRNSGLKNSAILTPIDFDTALEVSARAHVSGTIRGRAGVVLDNALVYVTGGAAWADVRQTGVGVDPATGVPVAPAITANSSNTVWGGVIGAGVEFAVAPNWTVGAEVLHTVYQDVNANLRNGGPAACTDPGPLTGL